jgi:DNA-directed RNA polymerase subunit H (RpoH/RPB5)
MFKSYEIDNLPKIFEDDPQMIWIGANPGDIIKSVFLSEVTIESINYRIVISNNN